VDGSALSPLSGVVGLAPACALAGAFAKPSIQASSGPLRSIAGFALIVRRQNERGVGSVPSSNRKKSLRLPKNLRPVTGGTIFCTPNDPPAVQPGGRVVAGPTGDISGIEASNRRCATPSSRQAALRTFGALRPGLDLRWCAALSRCCTHGACRVRVSVPEFRGCEDPPLWTTHYAEHRAEDP
jgi:hypothetical protein